jgi:hypothetical protein
MPKQRVTCSIKPVLIYGKPEYGSNTECAADPEAGEKYTVRESLATAGMRAILTGGSDVR